MKLVAKEVKVKTVAELEKELQAIKKQLEVECTTCDGTGKPITKTGKPPQGGHGDARCGTCYGEGTLGNRLDMIETNMVEIKREVKRIKSTLDAHINKQSVEIRVLPEGHNPALQGGSSPDKWERGWEDYTGRFDLDNDEEMSIVIGKAVAHFETYFKEGVYHRNKKLGLFLSNATSGRHLIEEMETGD